MLPLPNMTWEERVHRNSAASTHSEALASCCCCCCYGAVVVMLLLRLLLLPSPALVMRYAPLVCLGGYHGDISHCCFLLQLDIAYQVQDNRFALFGGFQNHTRLPLCSACFYNDASGLAENASTRLLEISIFSFGVATQQQQLNAASLQS